MSIQGHGRTMPDTFAQQYALSLAQAEDPEALQIR